MTKKTPNTSKAASADDVAYEVRRSDIHGNGVFARRKIAAGERIVEYEGERITSDESAIRADRSTIPFSCRWQMAM